MPVYWKKLVYLNGSCISLTIFVDIQMLSYFGHIARRKGNNWEKVIMQGMIEKKRRKGRPQPRRIDQIRLATGLPLHDCYALAEDRHLWCRIYEATNCQPCQEQTNQIFRKNYFVENIFTRNLRIIQSLRITWSCQHLFSTVLNK